MLSAARSSTPKHLQARTTQAAALPPCHPSCSLPSCRRNVQALADRSGRSLCLNDIIAEQLPDPLLRAAIKEPLAFWGGIFAGALQLNLSEDPLRDWVQRTSQAARQGTVDEGRPK